MAKYGVCMLERLVLRYCDHGGSSRGMRTFLETGLPKFSATNEGLLLETHLAHGRHPQAVGLYRNGRSKPICLKNLEPWEILERVEGLRTCHGRGMEYKVVRVRKLSRQPSIQGMWNVDTFAADLQRTNATRRATAERMAQY